MIQNLIQDQAKLILRLVYADDEAGLHILCTFCPLCSEAESGSKRREVRRKEKKIGQFQYYGFSAQV